MKEPRHPDSNSRMQMCTPIRARLKRGSRQHGNRVSEGCQNSGRPNGSFYQHPHPENQKALLSVLLMCRSVAVKLLQNALGKPIVVPRICACYIHSYERALGSVEVGAVIVLSGSLHSTIALLVLFSTLQTCWLF